MTYWTDHYPHVPDYIVNIPDDLPMLPCGCRGDDEWWCGTDLAMALVALVGLDEHDAFQRCFS